MTYQEIKDRLSKCELTLEKFKNGTLKPTKDNTVEKLQILKESLEKQLAEANAIITTKRGQSKVVTGVNNSTIQKLKQDSNIDTIEKTDGTEIKEMKPGDPEAEENERFKRLSPKDQNTVRAIQAMIAKEKAAKNEYSDGPPISQMSRADMIDFLNTSADKVKDMSDDELRDAAIEKNADLRESKEGEINVYGYQTKHFDICPGATALFKKMMSDNPISKYKPLYSDDAQAQMIKFAKLHDALFAIEKVVLKGVDKEKGSELLDKAIKVADDIYELGQELGLDKEHRGQDLGYIQGHIEKINDAVRDDKVDEVEDGADTDYAKRRKKESDYHQDKEYYKEDMDVGHQDDEPSMLKSSAMETATYAAKLYKKLNRYDQFDGEVDFPNWWQKKLILARDYMSAAFHYLDSEEKQPAIDKLALEENEIGDSGKDVGMGYENARDMIAYFREKIYPHMSDQELEEFRQVMFDHLKDAVAETIEENVNKIAGGIPFKREGNKFIITEPLDDATKERIMKRAKEHGHHAAPNQSGGVTIMAKEGKNEDMYKPAKLRKLTVGGETYELDAEDPQDEGYITSIEKYPNGYYILGRDGDEGYGYALSLDGKEMDEEDLEGMYEGKYKSDAQRKAIYATKAEKGELNEATDLYDRNGITITRYSGGKGKIMLQISIGKYYIKFPADDVKILRRAISSIEDDIFDMKIQGPVDEDDNPVPQGKHIKVDDMQFMHDQIVSRMKQLAKIYKEKGPEATVMLGPNNDREVKVVDTLKILTKKKRELEDALQNKVAGIGAGQQLDTTVGEIGEEEIEHDCASHVLHEKYGKGICIPEQHTLVKEGDKHVVTHYDVLFKEGKKVVKNIPVSELKIITESHHGHKRRKK